MPTSGPSNSAPSASAPSNSAEQGAPRDEELRGVVPTESWSVSLESWARARHGEKVLTVPSTMDFAPLGTLRPQTFYELPVVLAVMTRRTASLHAALTRAVEIIREATYAFRAVVVTDVPTAEPIRTVDWTVEHLLGEADWAALQEQNWLPAAVDHLEWARRQYGASLVLAPETPYQVLAEVARVGAFTRAPEKILDTAGELARESLALHGAGETAAEDAAGGVEQSLRGWWVDALQDGITRRVRPGGGFSAEVSALAGPGAGVLVADGETAGQALQGWAAESGWTVARLTGSGGTNPADVRLHQALVRAAGEGLLQAVQAAGPVLLITDQADAQTTGTDGVVVLQRPEAEGTGWTARLQMSYGASTRIRAAELPSALDRLRRIHLATTL